MSSGGFPHHFLLLYIIEYTFLSIYIRPSGGKLPLKRPETATVAEEIQTEQA